MVRPHFSDYQSRRSNWTSPTRRYSDIRTIRPDSLNNLDGRSGLIIRIVSSYLFLVLRKRIGLIIYLVDLLSSTLTTSG